MNRFPSRRRRAASARPDLSADTRRGDDSGLTLVELLVAAVVTLLVLSTVPALFETVSISSNSSSNISAGTAEARLALESLSAQVVSAVEICLPAQFTEPGFTVRIGQIVSTSGAGGALTTYGRWDQWRIDANGDLQEETSVQVAEQSYGFPTTGLDWNGWSTVAAGIVNSSSEPPFTWPDGTTSAVPADPTIGQPEALSINLVVQEGHKGTSETVEVRSTVAALDALGTTTTTTTSTSTTTSTTVPSTSCASTVPAE